MGKHLTCLLALAIFIGIGAACKYSPFANGSSRYACEISGEPMPKTSEEFLKRAARHLADNNSAGYNECAFGAVSEAIKLDPANAEAYALRGSQHLEHRRIDAEKNDSAGLRRSLEMALSDLNKAIELDPKRSNFYAIRSSVYAESHYLGSEVQKKNVFDDLTRAIELGKPSETLALLFLRRGHFIFTRKMMLEAPSKTTPKALKSIRILKICTQSGLRLIADSVRSILPGPIRQGSAR